MAEDNVEIPAQGETPTQKEERRKAQGEAWLAQAAASHGMTADEYKDLYVQEWRDGILNLDQQAQKKGMTSDQYLQEKRDNLWRGAGPHLIPQDPVIEPNLNTPQPQEGQTQRLIEPEPLEPVDAQAPLREPLRRDRN